MYSDRELSFEEFTETVRASIEKHTGDGAEIRTVIKNNNRKVQGLIIKEKESNIFPVIYLEEYYSIYQKKGMDEVLSSILATYENHRIPQKIDVRPLLDFEQSKKNLRLRVVNYERNKDFLKKVPYYKFLDLAVTAILVLKEEKQECAFITVQSILAESWAVSIEEIFQNAFENEVRDYQIEPVEFPNTDLKYNAFIMSNPYRSYGASVVLNKEALRKFSEEIQTELLFIIPSSIYEVILIPTENTNTLNELKMCVKVINTLPEYNEDFLSDNIYMYSYTEDDIKIV